MNTIKVTNQIQDTDTAAAAQDVVVSAINNVSNIPFDLITWK